MNNKAFQAFLILLLSYSPLLLAQSTGLDGDFTIFNNTASNTVVGFYTNEGSGWSSNWLSEDLLPNEQANASFNSDGFCQQTLQVGWLSKDGGEVLDEPIGIDICEASNVYLEDNDIFFD